MPQTHPQIVEPTSDNPTGASPDLGALSACVSELAHAYKSQQSFSHLSPTSLAIKRGFDVILASLMLIALAPLLFAFALLVRLDGGPALFRQQRVGRNRVLFTCYKFRSMRPDAEKILTAHLTINPHAAFEWRRFQKLRQDIRVTPLGHFIRRFHFDELPQLLNVLKGDMSLVGPRPCTPEQIPYYADALQSYERMRPGITGPWQVGGRNKLSFEQRVALEDTYVRNWNLGLDMVLLAKTIPTLLRKGEAF